MPFHLLMNEPGHLIPLVAATFLKLELLPQPTFHKRKAELGFLDAFFERVAEWREADEVLVRAAGLV